MTDKLLVLQSNTFETTFWVPTSDAETFRPVEQLDALTPHMMLLAGLGASTARALHTYARGHGLDLQHVELRLQYGQPPARDEARGARNGDGKGQIEEEIVLYGGLGPVEHDALLGIAHQCSIHQMLGRGLKVRFIPAQGL